MRDLTPKERKAADVYLDTGNKSEGIRQGYNLGSRGGYNTPKQKETILNNMSQQVFNREVVQEYIKGKAEGAASRIEELSRSSDNDQVKLAANKDILDRAGFKPKEVTELEVKETYDDDQIERAAQELIRAKQKGPDSNDGAEGTD
jgi:hypothetical protein